MSNLIPEQRVDKNGVTVTRHVRAAKASTSDKVLPKPKIAKAKGGGLGITPTKQQSRQHFYMYNTKAHPVDSELLTALGITPHHRTGTLASDFETYDVLAVTDRGTAIALLEAGVHSAKEAKKILKTLGKDHLLQDNTDIATEAINRNILPYFYVNKGTEEETSNPHFLDYMEVLNITALSQYQELHLSVRDGSINVSDIKELTAARITMAENSSVVKSALVKLANGTANYTVKEAGEILDHYSSDRSSSFGSVLRQAFELADRYGSDFAIEIPPENNMMNFSNYLMDEEVETERSKSLLRYALQIASSPNGNTSPNRPRLNYESIIIFHDGGADPNLVAAGMITTTQIDAIKNHGIAQSVSGGWL